MRSLLTDAKASITKPHNIAVFAILFAASVTMITLAGYIVWQRFVTPLEIAFVAYMCLRISRGINQEGFSRVVRGVSYGLFGFSGLLLAGGIIDNTWFTEKGYVMFALVTLLWWWIGFQCARLEHRMSTMSADSKKLVTESTAVIYAQMTHREQRISESLTRYEETQKRFGGPDARLHLLI